MLWQRFVQDGKSRRLKIYFKIIVFLVLFYFCFLFVRWVWVFVYCSTMINSWSKRTLRRVVEYNYETLPTLANKLVNGWKERWILNFSILPAIYLAKWIGEEGNWADQAPTSFPVSHPLKLVGRTDGHILFFFFQNAFWLFNSIILIPFFAICCVSPVTHRNDDMGFATSC